MIANAKIGLVPTIRSADTDRVSESSLERISPSIEIVYTRRQYAASARRLFDIGVAAVTLMIAAPLLLLAAAAIVIEDGGPVIFKQKRVGRFEKLFTIYKLRTMRVESCVDRLSPSSSHDPRMTRVGRWLRKTSIDELPQLFNVICGEMTLVGPRPEMPFVVRGYKSWQHLRHLTTPGVTGLWQVTCRSEVPLHRPEATLLDLEYIRTASPKNDLKILLQTVKAIMTTQGAH